MYCMLIAIFLGLICKPYSNSSAQYGLWARFLKKSFSCAFFASVLCIYNSIRLQSLQTLLKLKQFRGVLIFSVFKHLLKFRKKSQARQSGLFLCSKEMYHYSCHISKFLFLTLTYAIFQRFTLKVLHVCFKALDCCNRSEFRAFCLFQLLFQIPQQHCFQSDTWSSFLLLNNYQALCANNL